LSAITSVVASICAADVWLATIDAAAVAESPAADARFRKSRLVSSPR
jgi:hypothetical protein